ncbi:MAG TPA: SDR family oxidoreductase [Patescibacteria group bacterium]|nr:SDR family oxidoreductase [Patescibacteria group bacterium]
MEITKDTIALVTGASSGIGAALAIDLAKWGAKVAICARRTELLQEVAEKIKAAGGEALVITADLSKKEEAEGAVLKTIEHFGGIDILVNNAGRGNRASVEDTTSEQLKSMFAINVFSLWYTTAAALLHMRKQNRGHIINISSIVGKIAYPFNSAYIAAKHAVVGFTAALRTELVDTNIEATVFCPAGVETEWASVTEGGSIGEIFFHGIQNSRTIAKERGLTLAPLQRMMKAEEISRIIINTIQNPSKSDIFTHDGTEQLALEAAQDRKAFEQKHTALYLGMRKAYEDFKM